MMNHQPLISVIIPCYNVEKFVEECIVSVSKQKFQNWECLVINDGSLDKTWQIILEKTSSDPRFKVFSQENKGLSQTRNFGIENSAGKYLFFLDADDILPENCLQDFFENIEEQNDIITGITAAFTGKNFQKISKLLYPKEGNIVFSNNKGEVFLRTVTSGLAPVAQNRLYKTDFINKNNLRFQKGIYHEDELWFFETMYFARNVKFIDKETYLYRTDNSESITNKLSDKNTLSHIEILKIIYEKYYLNLSTEEQRPIIARYLSYLKKLFIHFSIRERKFLKSETINQLLHSLKETNLLPDNKKVLSNSDELYYRSLEKLSLQKFPVIQKYFFNNPVNSLRKYLRLIQITFLK